MNPFISLLNQDLKALAFLQNSLRQPSVNLPSTAFPNIEGPSFVKASNLNGYLNFQNSTRSPINNIPQAILNPSFKKPPLPASNQLELQQKLQTEHFNMQMRCLFDLKSSLLTKINQQEKPEQLKPLQTFEKQTLYSNTMVPTPCFEARNEVMPPIKLEGPMGNLSEIKMEQKAQRRNLKGQIRDIIQFMLMNFGRTTETIFSEERRKYSQSKDLVAVFDILNTKYASTVKTKEEMVKYSLRRALKFVKKNLKQEARANKKRVISKTLCDKYFKASKDEILQAGSEEDYLKVALPFRKNSKNKTMNINFINEVFSSEEFRTDYEIFLEKFDETVALENNNKIEKFVMFIDECISKKNLKEINNYKRIPWPKLWISKTKAIAQSLPAMVSQPTQSALTPSQTKNLKKEGNMCQKQNVEASSNVEMR